MPAITGIGLVTPLGRNVDETWSALLAGRYITDHAKLPDEPHRLQRAAVRGAREAMLDARWDSDEVLADETTALVVGTSKGPIVDWIGDASAPPVRHDLTSDKESAGRVGRGFGLSELAFDIAAELGMGSGPRLVLSAACASGLHAVIRAAMMIRSGEVRRALVVAAEASVHPLFLGSFQRLGVFPPAEIGCRPFDRKRAGFLMSEAAAAICLEHSEAAGSDRTIARIERFGMGADATHLTGGDSSGRTLSRLMKDVLRGRSVDLIHAHGTGTELNDQTELNVIESVLSDLDASQAASVPSLYSHKGSLGHSLGAAGLVALAISAEAHRTQTVPPNTRTRDPLSMSRLRLSQSAERREIRSSLTMAAGFGGPTAVVRLVSH